MDVLHSYLEPVEASGFRNLHLGAELLCQVLQNNAVGSGKKCQNVFDEMLLFLVEFLPVLEVLVEVDFVSSPEGGEMLFVHLVYGMVLDGEENEAMGIFSEDGLFNLLGGEGRSHQI
jgi:hypothetical protein